MVRNVIPKITIATLNTIFSVVRRINLFYTHLQQNIERVQGLQWLFGGDLMSAQVVLHAFHQQRELFARGVVGTDAAECVHNMRVREPLHNLSLHADGWSGITQRLEFLLHKNALRYGHPPNICCGARGNSIAEFHVQGRDSR